MAQKQKKLAIRSGGIQQTDLDQDLNKLAGKNIIDIAKETDRRRKLK